MQVKSYSRKKTKLRKEKFNSLYISSQIDEMLKLQDTNPTDTIGKSKELVESC